jgi:hypothetical protein
LRKSALPQPSQLGNIIATIASFLPLLIFGALTP